jgi:hypothetical protein
VGSLLEIGEAKPIGKIITTVLVKSNPAPTTDAAASIPPATPDPAARAPTRDWPDDHRLGLHDPVVEGARRAGVERHGLYRFRAHGQSGGGDGGPEQNRAREAAAIDQLHRRVPPLIEPGLAPASVFVEQGASESRLRFRYDRIYELVAIDSIVQTQGDNRC